MEKKYYNFNTGNFPNNFEKRNGSTTLLNPDRLANLHFNIRNITPEWIDGVYMSLKKQHRPNFATNTNAMLSHTLPSGVRIGATYSLQSDKNILDTPVVKFDVNPSTLSTNFYALYHICPKLRLEGQIQIGSNKNVDNIGTIEYIGTSATDTLTYYNWGDNLGRITLSHLESLTKRLAMGTEFAYQWDKNDVAAQTAFAGRYRTNTFVISATASGNATDISYWRQINDRLQIGSTLIYNQHTQRALASILYQFEFPNVCIRAMFDSDWSAGFTYTRRLNRLCCELGFSLLLCIPTNKFVSGFRFEIFS